MSDFNAAPPQADDAETAVLGSILLDNDAYLGGSFGDYTFEGLTGSLTAEMFHRPAHRVIYAAMQALLDNGIPADTTTLTEELKRRKQLDAAGGTLTILGLADQVATSLYVDHYARLVREAHARRSVIAAAGRAAHAALSGEELTPEIAARAVRELEAISQSGRPATFKTNTDLVDRITSRLMAGEAEPCVPTGFIDLDEQLGGGFHPGEMVTVAAASSMGKTTFALDIAYHVARHSGPAGVFSLEMPAEQLVQRALAREGRIDMQRLRNNRLESRDRVRLQEAAKELRKAGLVFDDFAGLTIPDFRARLRRMVKEHGITFAVLDYIQLMEGDGENRTQQVTAISRAIKASARELTIPIVALAQLNNEHFKRGDHRPNLGDVRETGAIVHDSDTVMFLYREEYYDRGSAKKGIAEVIIGKQRNGPIGTVELQFHEQHVRFGNLDRYAAGRAA